MLCQFRMYNKVIHVYIHVQPFFFKLFSHLGYYRILRSNPCAIQQVLVGYLFLSFFLFYFLASLQSMWDLGTGQGSNPCSLQWNHRASGLPEIQASPWLSVLSVIYQCVHVSPKLPISPSPSQPASPTITIHSFSKSMSLCLFCKQFICIYFFQILHK